MQKKPLVLASVVLIIISIIGLVFFAFEGGFGGRGYGRVDVSPRSLWLIMFVLPLVFAIVMIGYSVAFPTIEQKKPQTKPDWVPPKAERESTLDAVMRVLNEDERKVVEALAATETETMLQKDIRWKTGLTRVKTHRVLARLAKRGIVSVEKYYNTNKIALADWLRKERRNSLPQ